MDAARTASPGDVKAPADREAAAVQQELTGKHIWCYDGVCGVCNKAVQFYLRHDRSGIIRYAPLQGGFAQRELPLRGVSTAELAAGLRDSAEFRTFYLIAHYGTPRERLYRRSRAMRFALSCLPGGYGLIGRLSWPLPSWLFDWAYMIVSRLRYRIAGKHEHCTLATPAQRALFIED